MKSEWFAPWVSRALAVLSSLMALGTWMLSVSAGGGFFLLAFLMSVVSAAIWVGEMGSEFHPVEIGAKKKAEPREAEEEDRFKAA